MWLMKKFLLLVAPLLAAPVLYAQDLPDGPGKDTVEKVCTTCHDLSAITAMTGSADVWQSVADDMKGRGADATDDDFRTIVKYLAKYLGPPVHINADTADSLQTSLGLTADEAAAIVKYRTDKGNFASWDDLMKVQGLDMTKLAGLQSRIKFT